MSIDALRKQLIEICLHWQDLLKMTPAITGEIAELDAARIIIKKYDSVVETLNQRTSRNRGFDFIWDDIKYQVKGTRPSGLKNSKVWRISQQKQSNFDILIWINYDKDYNINEVYSISSIKYFELMNTAKIFTVKLMRENGLQIKL